MLGRSVEGRPIDAVEIGDWDSPRKALVVGCIHGNECSGIAIAKRLETLSPPRGLDLWIVPDLNPDGHTAGTRGDAHGVDLNRNFPWHWHWHRHRLTGLYDSGPRPLSEPESQIARRLILRLRPRISIWFHQHLNLVDESGGNTSIERRFANLAGLPVRRLPRYPGGVASWENAALPGTTAFVVELPPQPLAAAAVARFSRAVFEVAR